MHNYFNIFFCKTIGMEEFGTDNLAKKDNISKGCFQ